jgi:tetratricopeptide (TPR) repeat protein
MTPNDDNDNNKNRDDNFDTIQPAQITPNAATETPFTANTATNNHPDLAAQQKKKMITSVGLVIAILLALAVIFVLPEMVSTPDLATEKQESATTEVSASTEPLESPFQKAQLAKARREAQDVLSKLMAKQSILETRQVNLWAADAYLQALDTAKLGDGAFRTRDFPTAQQHYQNSLTALTELEAQIDIIFSQYLAQGTAALEAGDGDRAIENFDMALVMEPNDPTAQKGLVRATVLPQVIIELFNAVNAQQGGNLPEAKAFYQAALTLDADNADAQQGIAAINALLTEQDFIAALSKGYSALEINNYNTAITAFKKAIALDPSSSEASLTEMYIRILLLLAFLIHTTRSQAS